MNSFVVLQKPTCHIYKYIYIYICGRYIRYSFGLGEGEVVLIWPGGGRYGTHSAWAPCEHCVGGTTSIWIYSIRICSIETYPIRIYSMGALSHKDQAYKDL